MSYAKFTYYYYANIGEFFCILQSHSCYTIRPSPILHRVSHMFPYKKYNAETICMESYGTPSISQTSNFVVLFDYFSLID